MGTLGKAIIGGFLLGGAQLASAAFLSLRGKNNIAASSKALTAMQKSGLTFGDIIKS